MNIPFSFLLFAFSLTSLYCRAQTKDLTLNEVKFESVNGTVKNKSAKYSLVFTSRIKRLWPAYTDSLITDWLARHPKAVVVPIMDIGGFTETKLFCLLIDQRDTINNYLVRNGCFSVSEMYGGNIMSTGPGFHITPQEYKTYVAQIK